VHDRLVATLSATWLTVLVVGLATMGLKATGPVLVGGRALPAWLMNVVSLFAPALLAALVITQAFADGGRLVLDARAAGLGAGAVAAFLRAPLAVVIVVAAAATALVRAL
jgi:branched-subunit amino acid transport protein